MKNYKFSKEDIQEMNLRGISEVEVDEQLQRLIRGSVKVHALKSCRVENGIGKILEDDFGNFAAMFQNCLNNGVRVAQLVPASGAASRMFKGLDINVEKGIRTVLEKSWSQFPFSPNLKKRGVNTNSSWNEIARVILDETSGLGLAKLPKGLVPFHRYSDGEIRTAFQEHAAEWHCVTGGAGRLCFTVPVSQQVKIEEHLADQQMDIHYQTQHPSTDLLAWDLEQDGILRDEGRLVWRPGGHGALLKNLEEVGGDLVFIRNIDNVVDERRMTQRARWQSMLGGRALTLKEERDSILRALRKGEAGAGNRALEFLASFIEFKTLPDSAEEIERHLDRPIRVAGMVVNSGQPGGGPFWIADANGHLRPGIAESAELEPGLMASGTHFNPVDMACILTDADGLPHRLSDFADANAFFTAEKTYGARPIRILEHPGLWNGGMAGWLTEFVEVPSEIFAPVKTVFDLLDRNPQRRA